ncbi:MAG: carboxylating nicotinate-nucleotide diphosphorylase, partial [Desulfovibrionaceae bacterium]|nr:carboxylating nicotinate-nucleotide diphosphorylase [Desulfovibrionaceae bacterium]
MHQDWSSFFSTQGLNFLKKNIQLALEEDGPELTAKAIFNPSDSFEGHIVAKEATWVVGLPLISLTLESLNIPFKLELNVAEGDKVQNETLVAKIQTSAYALLKAERIILNYISHLSGIANLTARYVKELEGTSVRLLDTRKTTPGLRWPEKYAVQMGGGYNHRMDLASMLMLKDNHIDAQGSILKAVAKLRNTYNPCPPIEVECRNLAEVEEAVKSQCERIMLDNMDLEK